ncbi:ferrous iron transport protein A [Lactococcus nasutitermitis]|uniref:Ferrous iron transport protein A n=1 Tax=Lactococcus nasutitermitis TaxID=1652957 RepID=A0ABV9JEU3_9LACT|nr:ferrous iron transport protein A [Lactococcus nasutitermitis]
MKTLNQAHIGQVYYISELKKTTFSQKLRELGFIPDKELVLLSLNEDNAIVKVGNTRLALSLDYLRTIIIKNEQTTENMIGLSSLTVGQTGVVRMIDATGEIKRRLMDMGITRGTSIFVRKLAPLGDPMELHLRGYALSLRKNDAEKIKVTLKQ